MARTLTPKQAAFVREYQVDLNATQAAIRAGYAEASAHVTGSQLLRLPKVTTELAKVQSKALERVQAAQSEAAAVASAQWIIDKSVALVERCTQAVPVLNSKGEPTGEYTFDSGGANRALDRLAKMHPEFSEKHEVKGELRALVVTGRLKRG